MSENELNTCNCKRKKCIRHGKCKECIEHHDKTNILPQCKREKKGVFKIPNSIK